LAKVWCGFFSFCCGCNGNGVSLLVGGGVVGAAGTLAAFGAQVTVEGGAIGLPGRVVVVAAAGC